MQETRQHHDRGFPQPSRTGKPARDFSDFVRSEAFPCVGAKSALARGQLVTFEAGSIHDAGADVQLHRALEDFAPKALTDAPTLWTFICLFNDSTVMREEVFEAALWARLRALHQIDLAEQIPWADEVSDDPGSPDFSMSIAGTAYFVVGLHPGASRAARRFHRPALVFNARAQFDRLKADGRYGAMQKIIREREVARNGSINPMLAEFGTASEARQYSGRRVEEHWRCPFKAKGN